MNKQQIQTDIWGISELMRDVTAEPFSRGQILRPEQSQRKSPNDIPTRMQPQRQQRGASECLVDTTVLNTRSVHVVPVRGFPSRLSWIKRRRLEGSSSAVKSIPICGRPSNLMAGPLYAFLFSCNHKPKVSLHRRDPPVRSPSMPPRFTTPSRFPSMVRFEQSPILFIRMSFPSVL